MPYIHRLLSPIVLCLRFLFEFGLCWYLCKESTLTNTSQLNPFACYTCFRLACKTRTRLSIRRRLLLEPSYAGGSPGGPANAARTALSGKKHLSWLFTSSVSFFADSLLYPLCGVSAQVERRTSKWLEVAAVRAAPRNSGGSVCSTVCEWHDSKWYHGGRQALRISI